MMRSGLFFWVSLCSLFVAACSNESAPPGPIAGSGTMMGPITGVAGASGAAPVVAGMGPAGSGAAGMGPAGGGAAGMGPAGSGAAGMSPAGSGAGGMPAGGAGAAGAPAFTPGSATFSAIYQEIIVGVGCNGGPTCHASVAGGALKMTTKAEAYMALVGVKAGGVNLVMNGSPNCKDSMLTRVTAGDPAASLLFDKVNSAMPKCGGKMPPSGALPADKIEQIRKWIMDGAKDN